MNDHCIHGELDAVCRACCDPLTVEAPWTRHLFTLRIGLVTCDCWRCEGREDDGTIHADVRNTVDTDAFVRAWTDGRDRHAFWCDAQSGDPCDCPYGHRECRRRSGLVATATLLAMFALAAIVMLAWGTTR